MNWRADLGARDRMDWRGFLSKHQTLLRPLAFLPRLGKLDAEGIDAVCKVVGDLESFKRTSGRMLVFGSKAAHFHFPGLVPVISSEVVDGLATIEKEHSAEIGQILHGEGRRFRFSTPEQRERGYRNYVALGNELMRDVDTKKFLGSRSNATYDLHAKVFEWWVIANRK